MTEAASLGRLSSLHWAHGPVDRVLSRSLQHQLGQHAQLFGWTGRFLISLANQAELTLLILQLPRFNRTAIPNTHAISHVYTLQDVLTKTEDILHSANPVPALFVSDASASHSFIYLADGTFSYVDFPFTDDQAAASSSFRELLAIHQALVNDSHVFASFSSQLVYWQTDIKRKERDLNIAIIPVWTPRDHSRIAAAGYRFATITYEWFIDRVSLAAVFQHFLFFPGPNSVDCFALSANSVSDAFYSLIPQQNSLVVNFFANLARQPDLFLCPLVSQITRAFRRILSLPGKRSLLIVPHWPSSAFWPVLLPGGNCHPAISASHVFQPTCYSPVPSFHHDMFRVHHLIDLYLIWITHLGN